MSKKLLFIIASAFVITTNAQVCFSPATNYTVGTNPNSVCTADFNGDGFTDLAAANYNTNNVSILFGTGTGTFGAATNYGTGSGSTPTCVITADFNGDGYKDLAVVNAGSNTISILRGDGAGNFGAATNYTVGTSPFKAISADFTGDGKFDLAVTNENTNDVSILINNGAGNFGAATNFILLYGRPEGICSGDFNSDGYLDLAMATEMNSYVAVLFGDGAGSFAGEVDFGGTFSSIVALCSGDFNGDGFLDLAVDNWFGGSISILKGDGAGSFSSQTNFPVGVGGTPRPCSVISGDFNNDGKLDLAVANGDPTNNNVSILVGTGTGSFGAAINFAAGTGPTSVISGDFNNDSKLDLAVSNGTSNNVSILLNTPLTITVSATATVVCNGTLVTLTGGGATTYTWSANAGSAHTNTVSVSPTSNTTYTVTGKNSFGCKNTATTTITVNALPTITVNSPTICIGSSGILTASGATTYTWSTIQNGASISVNPTVLTNYTVTGTDVNTCTNTAVSAVSINPLPIVTVNSPTICIGSSGVLTANGATTYTWSTTQTGTGISVNPTVPTNYTVTGTDVHTCTNTAVSAVSINPLPTVTVNSPTICIGSSGVLTASGAITYSWSTTQTGASISVNPTVSTNYTVTGSDVNSCKNTAVANVAINSLPTLTVTVSAATICAGKTTTLTATGATTYTWSTSATGATITPSPTNNTSYTVTGTDVNTCTNTAIAAITMVTVVTPSICMISTDSLTNYKYNVVYWDKTAYNNVDSFLVYRFDVSSGTYLRIGAVSKDSLSTFTDTAFSVGGPNGGNPAYSSYKYKIALLDTCGNIGGKSPYHQSMFIQENLSNFSWTAYVDSGQVSLPAGYAFLRDDNNTGAWHILTNTSSTSATDPNYNNYPNGNWRIDALGFNCTPTLRQANNSTQSAIVKSKSNITNNRTTSVKSTESNFSVYPNPTNGNLTINFTNSAQRKVNVKIMSAIGQEVYSETFTQTNEKHNVDLSKFENGIYLAQITTNNITVTKRIVKN